MYRFDIFISYRRAGMLPEWIHEHFMPVFEWKFGDAIAEISGRGCEGIFYDEEELEAGNQLTPSLREALRRSRCLVGLWSPQYFLSDWCVAEAQTFLKRQELTGHELVAPASVHDGASFPHRIGDSDICDIVRADLRPYVIPGAGFKKTEIYPLFIQATGHLAERAAAMVAAAPEFNEDWPVMTPEPARAPTIRMPRLVASAARVGA